ncbi:MAG: putative toxin-antitoxin system toxin component, PIN family [Turicibacter sp.]|nr:putative toxin-antitoxin system toxin component, PIN family [Turicibacter sp.]
MRIMVDTNILLSAFLFKSKMMWKIVEKIGENHTLVICKYIIAEFRKVASKKAPNSIDVDEIFSSFAYEEVETAEWQEYMGSLRDEDDKPILASAILADVDMIVTGDKDFLESGITHPRIISHLDFLRDYME